jgi:tetratricopeptide (TPR) repeat protein
LNLGKLVALAAFGGVIGVATLFNGLDRLSEETPGLARLVPAPFSAAARVAAANRAAANKDYAQVENAAARAVAVSPMDRNAVGLLATARLAAGKWDDADAAFRLSGQLGWRDIPTQLYWYQVGVESGDYTLAAQRIDAVLRAYPDYPNSPALLAPLEGSPAGQAALVTRLVERPAWLATYAVPPKDAPVATLETRALILQTLARRGITLGCSGVKDLTTGLVDEGRRRSAQALWTAHCTRVPGNTLIYDAKFQALDEQKRSPFDWKTYDSGASSAQTEVQSDGQLAASVSNTSPFTTPILAQIVSLEPGQYRVRLKTDASAAANRLFATLSCGKSPQRNGSPPKGLTAEGQDVTSNGCANQLLTIWAAPGPETLVLRQIEIKKLR